ncbi:MAG TPA: bifunctional YncE family protein/alkaline phosphatase family protein, partial [Candidatus Sulfotelmatobacter sp.]|nr:bifunctional YncE family protein/alkaline phosphatase family protein [Candidatus Sulfotelmatobacter sp.]
MAAKRFLIPTGQVLTPAGRQVNLSGMRPQALALSPNGRLLATAGRKNALALIVPATGQVLQTIPLSIIKDEPGTPVSGSATVTASSRAAITNTAELSFTGLVFSPDGRRLYLANVGGNVWMFAVNGDRVVTPPTVLPVPDALAPKQKREIPTGLAVSDDGKRLYVAGNLGGRLYELDALTGNLLRSWNTGVAPYDVVLAGSKAYVSNLGGRFPRPGELTAPAGKGTTVRVDPVRHIALAGSVTVVDLVAGRVMTEIPTGLHTSALAVSPGGKYVVAANTGDDTLSVIDPRTDQVVEKIWARQTPADLFGAQPNALAFAPDGKRLYVCNGTQNVVAVVRFVPEQNASQVIGLIPVGWFPGAIQFHAAHKTLCVANIKGIGAAKIFAHGEEPKLNTKDFWGTVSLVRVPGERQLAALTKTALRNIRYPKLAEAQLPARPDQPVRPVPERAGEPSPFKHVIYVIKENRSYDQILGDMPEGNGDTNLCIFGEQHTPNQHKIAREFVLLDNTYCSSVQSADGHQWTDSAIANEYVERQLTSGTPRSYPGAKTEDGVDALAWASSGFLWDNALAHGKTFRNYGEWMLSEA